MARPSGIDKISIRRRWCRVLAVLLALPCLLQATPADITAPPATPEKLTFGVLPLGGPAESLEAWQPFLDDMSATLKMPVRSFSVSSYQGLARALGEHRVDVAFASGLLALDAVAHDRMQVVAQLTRCDGSHGYYSLLLVRSDSPIRSLADLYAQPGRWRLARGETLSTSGYLVPETQVFASRKLDSDTFFAQVMVNSHQNNALAVANGEADIATNNSGDMERFAQRFPEQAARLRVLWKSSLIPHAVIIVRGDLPAELRQAIADFITRYAKRGNHAPAELANLKLIHDISGFSPASNATLEPLADITYTLERRRALAAKWVDDDAMQAQLQRIDQDHRKLVEALEGRE